MISKVLCFGELLLRVSPAPQNEKDAEKHPFYLYMGGAEANVATALAGWTVPVKYCTALPANFMSSHIIDYLEYKGIFTSSILMSGDRIGVYYLERGADLKGSVVYDRAGSSFSQLKPGMIDWDKVFRDVSWFNFTAISPALSWDVAQVCLEAVKAASAKGIKISCDLNYRSRLWKYGMEPVEVMPALIEYCDLVMGNIWSANTLLGTSIDVDVHAKKQKQAYLDHAELTSKEIMAKFPKVKTVANTFRFDSEADHTLYYTTLYHDQKLLHSPEFTCGAVVDRSGSGDCFMAGLIYGFYHHNEPQDILNYATAAAFGKLQEQGDATEQDVLMVKRVTSND